MIDQESLNSIESLHRMKAEGIITEAEFEASKQKVLFGQRPTVVGDPGRSPVPRPRMDDYVGWAMLPLRKYADFTGRSSRKEFWLFQLAVALALFAIVILAALIDSLQTVLIGVLVFGMLGLLVPTVAVQVRRFHDQDRSGWFALLNLVPYAGALIVLVFMLIDSTPGTNQFGPNPKDA
jgi:uncharacterized membrane protein YhaH (DUF805 family)